MPRTSGSSAKNTTFTNNHQSRYEALRQNSSYRTCSSRTHCRSCICTVTQRRRQPWRQLVFRRPQWRFLFRWQPWRLVFRWQSWRQFLLRQQPWRVIPFRWQQFIWPQWRFDIQLWQPVRKKRQLIWPQQPVRSQQRFIQPPEHQPLAFRQFNIQPGRHKLPEPRIRIRHFSDKVGQHCVSCRWHPPR